MKGYLLLEDGTYFSGNIVGQAHNIIGEVSLSDDRTLEIKSKQGSGKIVNGTGYVPEAETVLVDVDLKTIKNKISGKSLMGKIVVDSLPMDYHIYDIKSAFPCSFM